VTYRDSGARPLYANRQDALLSERRSGDGVILFCGLPPWRFARVKEGAGQLRALVRYGMSKTRGPAYAERGYLKLRRGRYVIAKTFDRSLTLPGRYVDVLQATLPVVENVSLKPDQLAVLRDVGPDVAGGPRLLFSSSCVEWKAETPDRLRLIVSGAEGVTGTCRVFTAGRKVKSLKAATDAGRPVEVESRAEGDTLLLRYSNAPFGVALDLAWGEGSEEAKDVRAAHVRERPAQLTNVIARTTPTTGPGETPMEYRVTFTHTDVTGIGREPGVCRRDPSDVIRVGDAWYVWYSRTTRDRPLYPSGYHATVWYATSRDEGRHWTERGEAVGLGPDGAFDSCGVFTPNILPADGKYYLFYTGVANGFKNQGYSDSERTAIGVAVADSPDGPWRKLPGNPVLTSVRDPARFDSFRVDDTCFIVRDGRYWMYYKGRPWKHTPGQTKMGVAVAERPEGPYRRLNNGDPVQDSGHEVMVWPFAGGVMSLVSATGPHGQTLQYAADGLHFRVVGRLPGDYPRAPGAFRPDLTDPSAAGRGIRWGIEMVTTGGVPYLRRYEIRLEEERA